ncbi:MAG TPA: RraA family protein [Microbacteriaceae bacterium]
MSSDERGIFRQAPGDERLSTAVISDSLDSLGLRHQVVQTTLTALCVGSRAFGRASTARFEPTDVDPAEGPYEDAIAFIDALVEGDVAVLATGANYSTAYWGELFSAAALGRRAVGMITDGPIRDTPKIMQLGFACFSATHRPIDFRARMRIVAAHQRVELGGVAIDHGDLVLADDDGVVVIPKTVEAHVLERARARTSSESAVLVDLRGGATLRAVWDRHHVL